MVEWSPFRAFAPRKAKRFFSWQDAACLLLFAAGGCWLLRAASKLPGYQWQWDLLAEFFVIHRNGAYEAGLLLRGLFTTLRVGAWTFVFSLLLGGIIGIAYSSKSLAIRLPCHLYVNLLRNTPPLVILFVVYFFAGNLLPVRALEEGVRALPSGMGELVAAIFAGPGQMDRMLAAMLALGAYQGAYVAEIVRGGLASIPRAQMDAARALGFGRFQAITLVILPQAAISILPPLTGQCVSTFKDSALASLISLPDLTFQSLEIMAVSQMTFEIWISAAALYLFTGVVCACLGRALERHFSHYLNK